MGTIEPDFHEPNRSIRRPLDMKDEVIPAALFEGSEREVFSSRTFKASAEHAKSNPCPIQNGELYVHLAGRPGVVK
jgi:hypothetical protein